MAANVEKEPPPTPKSKLETLPREDLIRFAKKQAITAKQLRERNDGKFGFLKFWKGNDEGKILDILGDSLCIASGESEKWSGLGLLGVVLWKQLEADWVYVVL